jgi:hypothetical protein
LRLAGAVVNFLWPMLFAVGLSLGFPAYEPFLRLLSFFQLFGRRFRLLTGTSRGEQDVLLEPKKTHI